MRLSVASTGGAAGSGSAGDAALFNAAYSLTGSTTQPSDVPVCAELEATQTRKSNTEASETRDRFMGNLLCSCAGTLRDVTATSPQKINPHFGSNRDRGVISS